MRYVVSDIDGGHREKVPQWGDGMRLCKHSTPTAPPPLPLVSPKILALTTRLVYFHLLVLVELNYFIHERKVWKVILVIPHKGNGVAC